MIKYIILANTMYKVTGEGKGFLLIQRFIICVPRPLPKHELEDEPQFKLSYPIINKFIRVKEIYEPDKKVLRKTPKNRSSLQKSD